MSMNRLFLLGYLFVLWSSSLANPEDIPSEKDATEKQSTAFFGINLGALFANKNTAIIYSGNDLVTNFGINYVFSQNLVRQRLDDYFEYDYALSAYPEVNTYNTALDLGLHTGVGLNRWLGLFAEVNFASLEYEQAFTVEIDNPNNGFVGLTYEQVPIFGEEQRININVGLQLSLHGDELTTWYLAPFANFNSIRLRRNYFVINNQQYEIFHNNTFVGNGNPGQTGFGGGIGTGLKYQLSESIYLDFAYNLYYTTSKMNDVIEGVGVQHGILMRIIWGKMAKHEGEVY